MGWARLDDKRADNPKLMSAGFEARGLDEAVICWCAGRESDGFVPESAVVMLAAGHGCKNWQRLVERLVDVGRWHPKDGGWEIHDYLEFNPSRASREAERERKRAAGRLGGIRSGEARAKQPASEPPEQRANGSGSEPANPRPVPSRPHELKSLSDLHARPNGNGETGCYAAPETETTTPAEQLQDLTSRIAAVCNGDNRGRVLREAAGVALWALPHVDTTIVDEALGWFTTNGHQRPALPRAVAAVIRSKAGDHHIAIPEFRP